GSFMRLRIDSGIYVYLYTFVLTIVVEMIILMIIILLVLQYRIHQHERKDIFVSSKSELLTTRIGVTERTLLLYFAGAKMGKETIRGTTLAFYLFIYIASLIFQITFAGTGIIVWKSVLYALPIVVIGLILGQKLFIRINQRVFQIFT